MSLQNAPSFYNPKVHAVQGVKSKTFKRIALDTTMTIPELFEYHAKHSPEHPVFVYADDEQKEHVLCYPEVYRAIRKMATISHTYYTRLADYYARARATSIEAEPPVMGILATIGTGSRLLRSARSSF